MVIQLRGTVFGLLLAFGPVAAAQEPRGSAIRGVVWDSVEARPLAGATVQLVAEGASDLRRSTSTDSLGRFVLDGIPAGRYTIGFLHATLDSLGLEPLLRAVEVGDRPVEVELAIPSPRRIRDAACGARGTDGGVVIGFVRDARDGSALAGVAVRGEWLEYTIVRQGTTQGRGAATDTTRANGWFALCGVPSQGQLLVSTARSSDSTARIEVTIPPRGFLRRDLYVVPAAAGVLGFTLSGYVLAAATQRPLRDAEVGVAGGGRTRSDVNGAWVLNVVPAGTRMLDVRALGYYPVHRPVDVVPGAPPVRVELFTMRAMLDTIRVTAPRVAANMREFEQRRRASASGRFLTRDFIDRLHPVVTSDLFKHVAGMNMLSGGGVSTILLKGAFDDDVTPGYCRPVVWVDGMFLDTLRADDLDMLTRPDEIGGIEIYHEPFVPPQYSRGLFGGCGSIVVWRLPPVVPDITGSRKRRALKAAAFVGAGILFGTVLRNAVR